MIRKSKAKGKEDLADGSNRKAEQDCKGDRLRNSHAQTQPL
jgi:hypothetical protein